MIVVGVDVFSGRQNPSWFLNERDSKALLKRVCANREAIGRPEKRPDALGYRGVYVGLLSDHVASEHKLPLHFMLANGTSRDEDASHKIAAQLVKGMNKYPDRDGSKARTKKRGKLQAMLLEQMDRMKKSGQVASPTVQTVATLQERIDPLEYTTMEDGERGVPQGRLRSASASASASRSQTCYYEVGRYNPGFWNGCKNCKNNNNCYNYARNWRTDTFAQPGRASGAYPYSSISCAPVRKGALSDGAHLRYDCFPSSEAPRWLMALVIWPGWDYHWYRKHLEGFWGHKPGSTNARNTDNSGDVVYDPRTCDRGNYTQFCDFFYASKSMTIR